MSCLQPRLPPRGIIGQPQWNNRPVNRPNKLNFLVWVETNICFLGFRPGFGISRPRSLQGAGRFSIPSLPTTGQFWGPRGGHFSIKSPNISVHVWLFGAKPPPPSAPARDFLPGEPVKTGFGATRGLIRTKTMFWKAPVLALRKISRAAKYFRRSE